MADQLTPDQLARLQADLRSAQPSWERNGAFNRFPEAPVDKTNIKRWDDYQEKLVSSYETPDAPAPEAAPADTTPADTSSEYSFQLDSPQPHIVDGVQDGTVDVILDYGEINFLPPDGMDPTVPFTINLDTPGTEIWAQITYDTDTLAITDRTIEWGSVIPDSTFGTLIWPIGFVDWEYDGTGAIINLQAHNRHCGDINFQLLFGSNNGAPAFFVMQSPCDPINLPDPP